MRIDGFSRGVTAIGLTVALASVAGCDADPGQSSASAPVITTPTPNRAPTTTAAASYLPADICADLGNLRRAMLIRRHYDHKDVNALQHDLDQHPGIAHADAVKKAIKAGNRASLASGTSYNIYRSIALGKISTARDFCD